MVGEIEGPGRSGRLRRKNSSFISRLEAASVIDRRFSIEIKRLVLPRSGETKKQRKAEKKAAEVRAAVAAVAAAEADSSDDDSGTDEDDPLTPVVRSQATRVGRTPGYSQQLPPQPYAQI